jgi:predicted choloylglycine hydrolase
MNTTMTTIAGGRAGDALTVRHLRVDGTQHEIGTALARAAAHVHGSAAAPRAVTDVVVEEARRRWFATNHPVHSMRMRGIADHFGLDHLDSTQSLDWLGTYELPAGCSVAFYPGETTKHGHGILSRNFDFPTATFSQITGLPPVDNERPLAADPWVIELHPDTGYASLTVGIMDVMGAMDGVNEAGLTVALLADNETPDPEPTGQPCVGLSEQQVVRYLLDNCATVAEAKQALLVAKHYYFFTPCHFVVADRSGEAFVWEHSPRRNREVIVPATARGDGRLVCTNHLLHRWPDPTQLPADDGSIGTAAFTYRRWRTLDEATTNSCIVDNDDIREQFRAVSFVAPIAEARTFWHALYDVDEASAELTFHVRDVDGVSTYSDPIHIGLGQP